MREEGGTPAIVESIRAGLVMKLKMSVGVEFIMKREESLRKMFLSKFWQSDRMLILGHNNPTQLPIFSFLIRHPETGLYLHHNYVVALLNDLFGIQVVELFFVSLQSETILETLHPPNIKVLDKIFILNLGSRRLRVCGTVHPVSTWLDARSGQDIRVCAGGGHQA